VLLTFLGRAVFPEARLHPKTIAAQVDEVAIGPVLIRCSDKNHRKTLVDLSDSLQKLRPGRLVDRQILIIGTEAEVEEY
jgi:hypothetical protein